MRNLNSNNRKFLDAVKNKVTQELKDFKKAHFSLIQQLSIGDRRQRKKDDTLGGQHSIANESKQNKRILEEFVMEAQEFDKRLLNMGVGMKIKDLIKEKDIPEGQQS